MGDCSATHPEIATWMQAPLSHLMGKVAAIWGLSNHSRAERSLQSGDRERAWGGWGGSVLRCALCRILLPILTCSKEGGHLHMTAPT